MKKFVKENIKYLFLFLLFFFCLHVFYSLLAFDQSYNYGFSYAIARGEIPYKDFNIIVPPLSPLFYSISFVLFGSSLLVFNLTQAVLLCVLFYFLFKLVGNRAWLLLVVLLLPFPVPCTALIFQGYNFLLALEFVILMYLEKYKKSDMSIGLLLGLCVFTKQTTGLFLFLPSFYYLIKDKKKFFNRCIGFLIPCFVFLIYLLMTGSFYEFWDMCLFGMLDFTGKNGGLKKMLLDFNFYLYFFEVVFLIFYLYKNRKNNKIFYFGILTLIFSTIAVPLFDSNHVGYFSFVFAVYFIDKIKIKFRNNINVNIKKVGVCSFLFALCIPLLFCLFTWNFKFPNVVKLNNYGYAVVRREDERSYLSVTNFMLEHKNSILFAENTYIIKAILGEKINYYDLLNYGNHGYKGLDKLFNMLKSEHDKYIIIDMNAYNRNSLGKQFIIELCDFVMDNCEKVGEFEQYEVYYKK